MSADSSNKLTPLESRLLEEYSKRYKGERFPIAEDISVSRRETTTAGRRTYLVHQGEVEISDGQLDLGRFSQLNLEGLENGASFSVQIEDGRVVLLDIIVNGDGSWPDDERSWIVCDPETGEFTS